MENKQNNGQIDTNKFDRAIQSFNSQLGSEKQEHQKRILEKKMEKQCSL